MIGQTGRVVSSSDSSMDDCNTSSRILLPPIITVQIPLWTIVTSSSSFSPPTILSSDSSMDDCNKSNDINRKEFSTVQIPLWTIVTPLFSA